MSDYPEHGVEGTITISFRVTRDGLEDLTMVESHNLGFEEVLGLMQLCVDGRAAGKFDLVERS